jgi:thioesterase domain-containing protein
MIGSSFGSLLALELASKLESDNMNGQLIMLDGGPDYLKHADKFLLLTHIGEYVTQHILAMINSVYPGNNISYEALFEEVKKEKLRVDKILKFIQNSTNYHFHIYEDIMNVFNGIAIREKIYDEYDGSHLQPVESKIMLIRTQGFDKISDIDETYGLNKYARHDVDVKFVKGNHITMYDGPELSQILKEALEVV